MPIYEYRCQGCEDEFEAIQKMSDRPLRKCKKCGGKLEKLLSRTSFVLRGGGWYADGYGEKGSKGKKDAPSKSADSKSSSKTETKSESKSETKPKAAKKKAKS